MRPKNIDVAKIAADLTTLNSLGFVATEGLGDKSFYIEYFGEYSEYRFFQTYSFEGWDLKEVFNDLIQYIKEDTAQKYREEIIKVIGEQK